MAEYTDYQRMPAVRRAPLIGLTGKARSGKDSVANRLVEQHGYIRVAFADPLKAAALALNPIVVCGEGPDDPFEPTLRLTDVIARYGWEVAKDEIPEVRRILQALGQGVRDAVGESVWRDKAMAEADRLHDAGYPVVITDVRYTNEADAIAMRGGMLSRVIRPGNLGAGDHRSETELDGYTVDYDLCNATDLAGLRQRADLLAEVAVVRIKLQ